MHLSEVKGTPEIAFIVYDMSPHFTVLEFEANGLIQSKPKLF